MILSIDPGNVTGVAVFDEHYPEIPPITYEVPGGLLGFVEWFQDYGWYGRHPYVAQLYIEDFIIRPDTHKKTREPAAYLILGYVLGKCMEYGIPCLKIGPAEHTPFTEYKTKSKSKIVRLGWSAPSKDMHADSASSVLLVGLMKTHRSIAKDLLRGISLSS